jgi:hypothetical protein
VEGAGLIEPAVFDRATSWRLARVWYGDKLEPDWRRHSLEEAETLFADLGLAGDFWRLR